MNRYMQTIGAAAALLILAAAQSRAADTDTISSLTDLDGGAQHYRYINPHAGFDTLPATPITNVQAAAPASHAQPSQQQGTTQIGDHLSIVAPRGLQNSGASDPNR